MTFLELASKRYSVRGYTDQTVEEEKLKYILEAGQVAPSAANFQPWHIIVLKESVNKERLHPVYPREWFKQADILLVICGDHTKSWKRTDGKDHCDVDISIITDHITLAAAEQGLGTCWICNFDAALCSEILKLPSHIEPIVILTLGYATPEQDLSRHTKRKALNEIIHFEAF
jgi:nitroreductase